MSPYTELPKVHLTTTSEFYSMTESIRKLMAQWEKHGQLIIAVDFDDTIYNYSNDPAKNFTPMHELLKEAVEVGLKIVIFTARPLTTFGEVTDFCKQIGLKIEGINKDIADLGYPTAGKIYYNLLLDDKAGLSQAYIILKRVVKEIKGIME